MKEKKQNSALEEDSVDIDLNDPDVENAATKIQAGFRGHKTRGATRFTRVEVLAREMRKLLETIPLKPSSSPAINYFW